MDSFLTKLFILLVAEFDDFPAHARLLEVLERSHDQLLEQDTKLLARLFTAGREYCVPHTTHKSANIGVKENIGMRSWGKC